MDYIQYSNAARAAARDIALERDSTKRSYLIKDKTKLKNHAKPITTLYNADFEAKESEDGKNIEVTVRLERNDEDFPLLLNKFNFPPKELVPISYTMPLEEAEE